MEKIIKYLAENIITTVFVLGTFLGCFMGWIFTKDYYDNNILSEKEEYILNLEQNQREQQQEIQVYLKQLEVYESMYGCL